MVQFTFQRALQRADFYLNVLYRKVPPQIPRLDRRETDLYARALKVYGFELTSDRKWLLVLGRPHQSVEMKRALSDGEVDQICDSVSKISKRFRSRAIREQDLEDISSAVLSRSWCDPRIIDLVVDQKTIELSTALCVRLRNELLNLKRVRDQEARYASELPPRRVDGLTEQVISKLEIERALQTLPEAHQSMIAMACLHELSAADIAALFGRTETAVCRMVSRIKNRLRNAITEPTEARIGNQVHP
jgi:DNA-directed RNA polymerase specialized sigma24 family protein